MVFSALLSLLPSQLALAASDQLIATSDSTYQMTKGTTFTVEIKAFISSSAAPQTANGNVKYSTGQLKVVSAQANGSGFGSPSITPGSGVVNFQASRSSSSKGVVKVFDITFQAIGAGTAIVEFTGDSRVNGATTTYKSSVFSITNPVPSSSPSVAPKPSVSVRPSVAPVPITSTTPTPSASPDPETTVPTPDPTGIVTSVNVDPNYTSVVITWKVTADNPKSTMAYGSRSSNLDQRAVVTQAQDGSFSASIANLQPGERYYFTITGSGNDNKTGTYSSAITTNGYPVTIVVSENKISAQGAQVKINNVTRTTGTDGKVTIGLAAGEYTGKITTSTASLDVKLIVVKKTIPTDGSAPPAQPFPFELTSSPLEQGPGSGSAILTFVGVLIAGTALISVGFIGFIAYRRRKFESGSGGSGPSTTVIIDDGYTWQKQDQMQQPQPPVKHTTTTDSQRHYNSSVYIDDEEPVDIFERKQ